MRNILLLLFLGLYVGTIFSQTPSAISDEPIANSDFEIRVQAIKALLQNQLDVADNASEKLLITALKSKNQYQQVQALNLAGNIDILQSQYDEARAILQKALSISQTLDYLEGEAESLLLLSKLYWYLEDFELTLSYAKEANAILPAKQSTDLRMSIYNMLGNALSSSGQADSAKLYFTKILPLATATENYDLLGGSYLNLAVLYDQKSAFDEGLFYYEKALKTFQYGKIKKGAFYSLVNIAGIYEQQNQPSAALPYLYQASKLMDSLQLLSEQVWLNKQFYKTYQQTGQKDSTLAYLIAYHSLKDSLFNKEKIEKLNTLENEYKNEKRFALLEQKAIAEANAKKAWIVSSIATLLVMGILIYTIFIRAERNRLAKQLLEKEHDRVLNENLLQTNQNDKLYNSLNIRQKELSTASLQLLENKEWLEAFGKKLEALTREKSLSNLQKSLKSLQKEINIHLNVEEDWEAVKRQFEQVNPEFFNQLLAINPKLTPKDLRLSAYLKMNMSTKEIAQLMNYTVRGVESMRYRLRKKLDIPSDQDLNIWMIQR